MDDATRSKMLKIGGGLVSIGKSFSPEAVGLDLRSLDTGDGSKGDSGGGDTKGENKPPQPPKVPESGPELPKNDKASDFGQAIKLAEGLGPQGLSNASWDQFKFVANSLPKDVV